MVDSLTPEERSRMMAKIRGANTKPELVVRSYLHRQGLRFRLHGRKLPGRPDIVLPKFNALVFVHGCFWHRHPNCRYAYSPKSRTGFWTQKFVENVARDRQNVDALQAAGWRVFVIWECETKSIDHLAQLTTMIRGMPDDQHV
jgi:DNA mismatch endonuclease (patch repair protein)